MMNKTHIQSLIILIILALGLGLFPISFTQSAANLPVFPGCQGFGCETVGGRGGRIIKVTNLNDSGPGSLRVAVEASGPRIVVFETSGTIALSSEIRITNPYLTIAGQTAPSPGITIKNYGLEIYTHDILIQHVRIRIGDQTPPADRLENLDAINTAYSAEAYNIVVDHVSLSWSIDGTFDIGGSTARERNITLSRSILSEHLRNAGHEKTGHSRALLVAEHTHKVSIIGNLLAHNVERNPLIGGNSKVVVANNLVYNWVGGKFNALLLADRYGNVPKLGNFWISILKNAYLKGPNTTEPAVAITVRGPNEEVGPGTKVYLDDNVADVKVYQNDASFEVQVSTPPISISGFTPLPSSQVYDHVLTNAGARPADRDAVDKRVVQEVKDRKGKIIDSQSEVGGWPTLAVNQRIFNIPSNPNGDSDNDGYTNIEEVLHQMAAEVEKGVIATPQPTLSVNFSSYFEAESGTINTSFRKISDSNASGGQYIDTPLTVSTISTGITEVTIPVTLPSTTNYYLWVRTYGPTFNNDAFYAGFNGKFDRAFGVNAGTWEWVKIESIHNSGNYAHSLNAGSNSITIGRGEPQARIDRIFITTDPNALPADPSLPPPTFLPQDLNQDGKVNLEDVLLLISDFGKTSGFKSVHDLNQDGLINILDVLEVARRWG